jgi:hypothetical protein
VASTEAPISITVKTPAGSLVTIRAEHGDELDQLVSLSLDAVKSAVTELEAAVRGVTTPAAPAMAPAQVAAVLGASIVDTQPADNWSTPSAPVAPSLGGKNCPHGKMTAIQGTGKDGKTYRGYFAQHQRVHLISARTNTFVQVHAEWNTFVAEQVK